MQPEKKKIWFIFFVYFDFWGIRVQGSSTYDVISDRLTITISFNNNNKYLSYHVLNQNQSTLYNLSLPHAFFWHYYSALAEFKGARLFILLTESQLFWVFYFVQKEIFLVLVW